MNMKKKWEKIKSQIFKVIITINSHHTGAYAAQAAYFFVLSLIPIFLLLLTMVRFTPITMSEVMTAVLKVFPESVAPMIRSIVSQVYFQSGTIVPVTIVVALWSAGKGVLSVTSGLNSICENMETRNYFYLRIRASFYTVIFLLAIVSSLVLSVFGNRISVMIYEHIPFLSKVVEFIIRIRTFVTFDCFLGSCVPISSEQEKYGKDNSSQTASGSGVYGMRMAAFVVLFFGIP